MLGEQQSTSRQTVQSVPGIILQDSNTGGEYGSQPTIQAKTAKVVNSKILALQKKLGFFKRGAKPPFLPSQSYTKDNYDDYDDGGTGDDDDNDTQPSESIHQVHLLVQLKIHSNCLKIADSIRYNIPFGKCNPATTKGPGQEASITTKTSSCIG